MGNHAVDAVLRDLGPDAPEFVMLLPELRERLPEQAPPTPQKPEAQKRRLFDIVIQWFARVCGDGGPYGQFQSQREKWFTGTRQRL